MKKYKIAFLVSHPIQYFSPLFRYISEHPDIDLMVYYCSDYGIVGHKDMGFQKKVKWDIPMLEGYKYRFLKNYSPIPSIFNPPLGLFNLGIVNEIFRNKYDAIVVHGWHYITYWLAYISAIIRKTPLFLRSESPLSHEYLKPKWKIFIKKMILGLLFRQVTAFLAIGKENKDFYKFYGVREKKIITMPYAVDNNRLIKSYEELIIHKEKIRKEMGIMLDSAAVLFSGKLIAKKRPMDLIKAYEKIKIDKKCLLFLGDGRLKKPLEDYARTKNLTNVYFIGFKNQTELPRYYVAVDIFILPSTIGETWGVVVNEAMCFHLPIIISDLVGCGRDLVKEGENGFIFKTGDINQLAERLKKLIQDRNLRINMGEKSFELISAYDYESSVKGLTKALEMNISDNR